MRTKENNVVNLQPNLAALYSRKVDALHEALASPRDRDEALTILRGLVEKVLIKANESEVEIELVGDIASMVELAVLKKGAKGAVLCPALRRSVKVVAGALNHTELSCKI